MNTEVGAWLWHPHPAAAAQLSAVADLFAAAERELSRFLPNSSLSRLNARAGAGPQPVSQPLQTVLTHALAAARQSDGVYNPALLCELQQAGYDRSFELLPRDASTAMRLHAGDRRNAWRQVKLDAAEETVELPAGLGLDLGGIAKGWTVDQALALLAGWGPALVDAGGDLRAKGAPNGEAWPIAVQDPFQPEADLMTLYLVNQAAATSSIGGRRWQRNGLPMHHLIDPRTGLPCASDLFAVTVIAAETMLAEVAAKVTLILGQAAGQAYLEGLELAGLLIGRNGEQWLVGDFAQYLEPNGLDERMSSAWIEYELR
jgi:thiamine biosynthesis lipoprotein